MASFARRRARRLLVEPYRPALPRGTNRVGGQKKAKDIHPEHSVVLSVNILGICQGPCCLDLYASTQHHHVTSWTFVPRQFFSILSSIFWTRLPFLYEDPPLTAFRLLRSELRTIAPGNCRAAGGTSTASLTASLSLIMFYRTGGRIPRSE